ncbi:MAG: hypothetical protein ORN49_14100, partial [Rhodobacteraceae bacterium]|nr:hypothetical protein [Paracoccaceae bacterium]
PDPCECAAVASRRLRKVQTKESGEAVELVHYDQPISPRCQTRRDKSARGHGGQMPAGWWILPVVLSGTCVWVFLIRALFF